MTEVNQSAVIMLRNPFRPSQREVMVAHANQTIRQWLGTQGIVEFDQPTICIKNGNRIGPVTFERLGEQRPGFGFRIGASKEAI